jgi:hypothetical protein
VGDKPATEGGEEEDEIDEEVKRQWAATEVPRRSSSGELLF